MKWLSLWLGQSEVPSCWSPFLPLCNLAVAMLGYGIAEAQGFYIFINIMVDWCIDRLCGYRFNCKVWKLTNSEFSFSGAVPSAHAAFPDSSCFGLAAVLAFTPHIIQVEDLFI